MLGLYLSLVRPLLVRVSGIPPNAITVNGVAITVNGEFAVTS